MTKTEDLVQFDPTVAELKAQVEKTKGIKVSDLKDAKQIAIVKENRIVLRDARVKIEKKGKELRADALAFQRAVIAKEKELIEIIAPEEERLSAIEEEAKALAIKEERALLLPERKKRLEEIKNIILPTDDELLDMDTVQFEVYFNNKKAESLRMEEAELERQREEDRKKQEAEQARIKAEQDAREREIAENARKEQEARDIENARIKAEQDKKAAELKAQEEAVAEEKRKIEEEKAKQIQAEKDRLAEEERKRQEKIAEEERLKKEEEERIQKEKEEQARIERQKEYTAFLASLGYSEQTKANFHIVKADNEIVVYSKVGAFKIK